MPEKVLVFGGTFDPPHLGHMGLLKAALNAVQPGKVLVIPASVPPHKAQSATPAPLRMQMCKCFLPLFENIEISDIEINRSGKSYTFDTITQLEQENPGAQLYLCIGGDMLRTFTEWYRYKELLKMVTLVAMCRQNDEAEEAEQAAKVLVEEGGRVIFAKGQVVQLSSTQIRADIAAGKPEALSLVPPPADEIIKENGLYLTRA